MKISSLRICCLFVGLAAGFSACQTTVVQAPAQQATVSGNEIVRLDASFEDALPVRDQLLLGTLLLEGTTQAVNADTAARLLPLWQQFKDLPREAGETQTQINAMVEQIQSVMSPEQIRAIGALQLTHAKMADTLRDMGVKNDLRPGGTPPASDSQNGVETKPAGTPMPENPSDSAQSDGVHGAPPSGKDRPSGPPLQQGAGGQPSDRKPNGSAGEIPVGTINPTQQQTEPAGKGAGNISIPLLDVLLRLLQTKIQS
jgi:hypothetical protein